MQQNVKNLIEGLHCD